MHKRILIAYDGSDLSHKAIQKVKKVVPLIPNIEVHIVFVAKITGPSTNKVMLDSITNEITENAHRQLDEAKQALQEAEIDVVTKVFVSDKNENPGKSICEYAEINKVSMIIVGSRGLGNVKGAVLGSVSNKIVKQANRPVLVIK